MCVQLEHNLERLRVAVDDLLVKLARQFARPKQQSIFLINNYDVVLQVLKVSALRQEDARAGPRKPIDQRPSADA